MTLWSNVDVLRVIQWKIELCKFKNPVQIQRNIDSLSPVMTLVFAKVPPPPHSGLLTVLDLHFPVGGEAFSGVPH